MLSADKVFLPVTVLFGTSYLSRSYGLTKIDLDVAVNSMTVE
jgi:hypothetical protein